VSAVNEHDELSHGQKNDWPEPLQKISGSAPSKGCVCTRKAKKRKETRKRRKRKKRTKKEEEKEKKRRRKGRSVGRL
jgi:hypothetical protein